MIDTKLLKQKILDLAIRGKLVPQDPNDEPASVLLERIRAEKERLVAEGKIKRSKSTSDNRHYQNVPFEIPENWKWCKLEDFSYGLQYGTSEKSQSKGLVCVLRMGNITRCGTIDYSDLVYSSNENDITKFSLQYNDLLFNRTNSSEWVGKTAIYKDEKPAIYAGYLIRIRTFVVYPDFINYVMNSPYHRDWCNQVKTDAVNQSNINAQKLSKLQIPIPPFDEQKRIVEKVQKWFALIDDVEQNKIDLLETIKQVKTKILDLAIYGKLVPQDPSDEPASELLKRIAPNMVACDTSHYGNLPKSWCVVKLGEIYSHTTGKALKKSNNIGVLRKYITTSNLYWNSFDFKEVRSMYFTNEELEKCTVHKGDLLLCNGGDVGRAAIWDYDYDICIQNHISRLRPKYDNLVENLFFCYMFMYLKQRGALNGKGVAITSLSAMDLLSIPLPLPPLSEQKRITKAIGNAFHLLDKVVTKL